MIDVTKLSEEERSVVLARRAYYREWKRKNADKVKDTTTRFFKKHAERKQKAVRVIATLRRQSRR